MAETIFALASGAGRAGVAVYRISGEASAEVCRKLTGKPPPLPRRADRVVIKDPINGETIDDGLVLWFPAPNSFTGEDVLELHLHGGRAVRDSITDILAAQIRPAVPGEFTRRAFEHGKMDLTAAEGIADLVDAETAAQRRQAIRQMQGELGALYEGWRRELLQTIAYFEAEIDFSDEELPEDLHAEVTAKVAKLRDLISKHLDDGHRGEIVRDGFYIAIVGPPNAGKSSLLNCLAQRDVAIVSEIAGTTRDVIEARLDLRGFPVTVADTAGIRLATDEVELEGVRRAHRQAAEADIKLVLFDGTVGSEFDPTTLKLVDDDAFVIINKCDLPQSKNTDLIAGHVPLRISALTGQGIESVLTNLGDVVEQRCNLGGSPSLTRVRHRRALEECLIALTQFAGAAEVELAAEDLRQAARQLGQIVGRVDVEEILDVIFREFCIGK